MADHAPGRAFVGCSGWSYSHWRGPVYPPGLPARQWFSHYATLFSTVEVNNTFYRLPSPVTVRAWAAQAPTGFVYALKLSQYGTHRMKLRDPARWLPPYLERALLLGDSLGPNLVQLPPHWHRDLGRLGEFLAAVPTGARWAVEVRDPSWLTDATYELLASHGAALCVHDLLPDHPWVRTANWAYARFHGPHADAEKYAGEYGAEGLRRPAQLLAEWRDEGCDVFAYFNNDADGAAVRDASLLAGRLTSG